MKNLELIRAERERQINVEGWSEEHDDEYTGGELPRAAACYAANAAGHREIYSHQECVDLWPWRKEWDKRKKHDRKRQLVIAGALILAELDRLDRIDGTADPVGNRLRLLDDARSPSLKSTHDQSVQALRDMREGLPRSA